MLYSTIEEGYVKFLYHKNVLFYDEDYEFWLIIDNVFAVGRQGLYSQNQLILWENFTKNDVNIICSSIQNSKEYNLRGFLQYLYEQIHVQNQSSLNMSTEDEAFKLLYECKQELKQISEELKFCTMIKKHISNIEELIYKL